VPPGHLGASPNFAAPNFSLTGEQAGHCMVEWSSLSELINCPGST